MRREFACCNALDLLALRRVAIVVLPEQKQE
jgi:hypothetical protein